MINSINEFEQIFDEVYPHQINLKSFEKKDILCPSIWQNADLKKIIRQHLKNIAMDFIEDFEMNLIPYDIVLVGSIAGYNNHVYKVTVPKIQCKNPVGSGDSFVAGIAVGIERGMAIEDILSLGAACGTANAMEDESGFVRKEIVDDLFGKIKIEQLV